MEYVKAAQAWVLLLRQWYWAVHEWAFWSGRVRHLTSASRQAGGKVGVLLWRVARRQRCISMTVFKHASSGFIALTDPERQKHLPCGNVCEHRKPWSGSRLAPTPPKADPVSVGSPQPWLRRGEKRADEPWGFAKRTRAPRCWATSSPSRITPTWCRVWPWSSCSAWCSRYSGREWTGAAGSCAVS